MNQNEIEHIEKSRVALEESLVGAKLVAIEKRKNGSARITLSDGRIVVFREDGECCASGTLKNATALLQHEHAVTNVTETQDGYRIFIYAGSVRLSTFEVSADEGTGCYGFGFSIDVVSVTGETERVYSARDAN